MIKPTIDTITKNEREKESYKRNAWNAISTMAGLAITGASGYYAFKSQNPKLSGNMPGVSNLTNFINNPAQEKMHPMNTIGKQIRNKALEESQIKKSLDTESLNKNRSELFGASKKDTIENFNRIMQSRDSERISHLSTLLDMINDPALNIGENERVTLINRIRSAIEVDSRAGNTMSTEISNFVENISGDKSLEDRFLSLHQKNKEIASLLATNSRTGKTNLPNPFSTFEQVSTQVNSVNRRNIDYSDLINDDLYKNYNDNGRTKNTIINRFNKIKDHLRSGNNSTIDQKFSISFDVIDEADGKSGFYAKISSRKRGASASPIIIPLLGADTANGKMVRLSADYGNAKLAHKYYFNVNDFESLKAIPENNLSQRAKAVRQKLTDLSTKSSFEDFAIDLFKMHSVQDLFEMNQAERNVFMETLTGLTQDISPNLKKNLGYTGIQAKHGMDMIANTAYFFHTKQTAGEAFPLDLNKLVGLESGLFGPAQGQAGIKRHKIAGKTIEQRMAIVGLNPTDITPVGLVRAIGGVKDQAVLPGSARPAQQFAKPEALLGYLGPDAPQFQSATELDTYLKSKKIGRGNIPMLATSGGQLLNIDPAFKDLPMVGANTSVIINFNAKNKKGQLFGLADAMQYSGGSSIVEAPIKKSFQVLSNMPNLSIYQSEQFEKLNKGEVVELFGKQLEDFYKAYGDKEGSLILGFNNNEPVKIAKQKGMLGLRLQRHNVAMNEKEGRYYLTGSIISKEQSKIFSEPIKGVFYGEEALLKEEGFTKVLSQAMGNSTEGENFIKNVALKGFNINFETSMVAGMDVVNKAPLFLASLMRGSVLHLGFDADEFDSYITRSMQSAGIEPAKLDTKVAEHTKKYFRQFGTAVFGFLQDKMNTDLPGAGQIAQLTPELIGTVMVPTQALEDYGTKIGSNVTPLFQELLASSRMSSAEQQEALLAAKKGMFVGAFSAYAGTQSSQNKSKLARVEPRFANFLSANLMSSFNMSAEETANVMSDLFTRQVGIGEKVLGISPLLLSSYSMNPNQKPEAMNMLIEDYISEGKFFKADRKLVKEFLDVNVGQESSDTLASYLRNLKQQTGDAMAMVFDIKDLFTRGVEGNEQLNVAAYQSFIEQIGEGKSQIVVPLSDALDSISGVELRKEGEDLQMESSLYRRINDIFANIREASVADVDTEQKNLIKKSVYYIKELQEITGGLTRQILSGRITGSATLEGKGLRLGVTGKDQVTILANEPALQEKIMNKLNKAMVESKGYAQFMDIQGFMYAYSQMKEAPVEEGYDKFDTMKRFLFGMEEGQFFKDSSGNILYDEKAFSPKGASGISFRNPQLGFGHISFGIDLYRIDTDNLNKAASLNNVVEYSKYGQQLQSALRSFIGSGNAFSSNVDQGIVAHLQNQAADPNSNFLDFSNLNKLFQLSKLGGLKSAGAGISVVASAADRILKKQADIKAVESIMENIRTGTNTKTGKNIQTRISSVKKQFEYLNLQLQKQSKLNLNLQLREQRLADLKLEKAALNKDKFLPKHAEGIKYIEEMSVNPEYRMNRFLNEINKLKATKSRYEAGERISYDSTTKKFATTQGMVDKLTREHFEKNQVKFEDVKYSDSFEHYNRLDFKDAKNTFESIIRANQKKNQKLSEMIDLENRRVRINTGHLYEVSRSIPYFAQEGDKQVVKKYVSYEPIKEFEDLIEEFNLTNLNDRSLSAQDTNFRNITFKSKEDKEEFLRKFKTTNLNDRLLSAEDTKFTNITFDTVEDKEEFLTRYQQAYEAMDKDRKGKFFTEAYYEKDVKKYRVYNPLAKISERNQKSVAKLQEYIEKNNQAMNNNSEILKEILSQRAIQEQAYFFEKGPELEEQYSDKITQYRIKRDTRLKLSQENMGLRFTDRILNLNETLNKSFQQNPETQALIQKSIQELSIAKTSAEKKAVKKSFIDEANRILNKSLAYMVSDETEIWKLTKSGARDRRYTSPIDFKLTDNAKVIRSLIEGVKPEEMTKKLNNILGYASKKSMHEIFDLQVVTGHLQNKINVLEEVKNVYQRFHAKDSTLILNKEGLPNLNELKKELSPEAYSIFRDDLNSQKQKVEERRAEKIKGFRFKQYVYDDEGEKIIESTDADTGKVKYKIMDLPETQADEEYTSIKQIKKRLNEVKEERLKAAKVKKAESIQKTSDKILENKNRISEHNEKINTLTGRILSEQPLDVTPTDGSEAYRVNSPRMVLGKVPSMKEIESPLTYYDAAKQQAIQVLDKDEKPISYKANQYVLDDLDSINSIDDLDERSSLREHLSKKMDIYEGYKQQHLQTMKELELEKQKIINSGINPEEAKILQPSEILDELLHVYKSNYSAAVGLGQGQLLIPEFETEIEFESQKQGSTFPNYKVKVRTDLSRAGVGDFDGDIYQAIMNNEKSAAAFRNQISKNVKEMQKTGAMFVINMEIAKDAMKTVAKRMGVEDMSYEALLTSESTKERILKGSVGSVDVAVKTAAVGAAYSIMESGSDIQAMRRTDLAAQTLISAAQESIVIKSKSLPLATNIGELFTEHLNTAFRTGNSSEFKDFLKEQIFKDTMFTEELVAKSAKVSNLPPELAAQYEADLMSNGGMRFSLEDVFAGLDNIVNQVRKRGLHTYSSDNILAKLLSSSRTDKLTQENYMKLVRNTSVLESVVANAGFSNQEQQAIFEDLMGAKRASVMSAVSEDLARVSNLRFSSGVAAVLGASYFLSSNTDTEELMPEEIFTDSRVSERIRNKQLVPSGNRDTLMSAEAMQRPFYKDMVNRVITPGQTPMLKQQSYLVQGTASSEYEANYISNMVLQTGGTSSMMMNDNRMPITGGYIDKLMGE